MRPALVAERRQGREQRVRGGLLGSLRQAHAHPVVVVIVVVIVIIGIIIIATAHFARLIVVVVESGVHACGIRSSKRCF